LFIMIRNYLLLLLLFVTLVTAVDLSDECAYVDRTSTLTDVSKVEKCFNSYTVDQEVIDLIFKNLDIIQDIYPYVDIAKNPPSKPDGYFKKMDYKNDLAELKTKIAESNKTFAEVIPPIMAFISGFRDGHFSLNYEKTESFYNIFADVFAILPFEWDVDTDDDYDNGTRHVIITTNTYSTLFLSPQAKQKIRSMSGYYYAVTIDGEDAFTFLANILGDYNNMKSAQGRLYRAKSSSSDGISLLQYPTDGIFKEHTIVFSDPAHTEVKFKFGFINAGVDSQSTRDRKKLSLLDKPFTPAQEKEALEIIKNFKKRTVRSEHEIVKCGLRKGMNYIVIESFSYDGYDILRYLNELVECIADFDTNNEPIIISLPGNGGGNVLLEQLTEKMLMPHSGFRTSYAARKTDKTKKIMVDRGYFGIKLFENGKTCDVMKTVPQIEEFWKYIETDKFGDITHKRTKKLFDGSLLPSQIFVLFQLKNVRKPTDIIVTTDGFCFSACSIFVDNIIRFGAGIVVGYGLTNPGDDLFVAAQCPSNVIDPAIYFEELSNNSDYGLTFQSTVTETYNVSAKMDESIPGDYEILRIDKYMKYYGDDVVNDKFIELTKKVHEEFKTKCNPLNKHLFMVTDECESDDPNVLHSGYACGENGEWDNNTCKIAMCNPPYVVDFDNNKCVLNPCDYDYVPPTPSSSEPTAKNSPLSSTTIISPLINLVVVVSIILFNLVN